MATRPAASQPRRHHVTSPAGTCRRLNTIQVDATSSRQVMIVMITLAIGSDTSVSGLNTIAASGG